jgi:hypothetical protein
MLIGSGTGVRTELVIAFMFEPAPRAIVTRCVSEYGVPRDAIDVVTVFEFELAPL